MKGEKIKMNYEEIAKQILDNVGGNHNIVSIISCFTRVRIEVRNKELVNEDAISHLEGVKGASFFNMTYQIVFGGKCNDVYDALMKIADIKEEKNYETHNYNMKDDKITLAWFQVSGVAGNSGIDNNIATASGVNVLAPTWYSVTDSSGNMSCYASAGLVNKMHQRGTDVWALVSDFDTNVDFAALYSSKKARTNMVNTLINDAEKYGFDGINLDCENIKSAYAKDYLQFVRELSIACERKGLVLSTDNYKPEAYNRCYNLKEQSRFVDYVIVMAYDEHYAGTDAGSVASLPFVKEAVEDTVQLVGKEHVIAGIPFYTRIWTTTDGNTTSRAVGMQAAVDQLNSDGQVALWNDDCGQYVASYTVGNTTRQIWFEEEKSIEAKMQVIQENNVAGVAGWKLGLEKSSVWPVISKYNK